MLTPREVIAGGKVVEEFAPALVEHAAAGARLVEEALGLGKDAGKVVTDVAGGAALESPFASFSQGSYRWVPPNLAMGIKTDASSLLGTGVPITTDTRAALEGATPFANFAQNGYKWVPPKGLAIRIRTAAVTALE